MPCFLWAVFQLKKLLEIFKFKIFAFLRIFSSDFNGLANPQETDYAQSTNQRAPFECVDVTKHFLSNFFFARFFFSNFRRGGNQIREPHQERKSLENWTAKTYQEKITRRHYFENWLKKVTQNFLVCDFWFRGFWPWPRPVPMIPKSWFWPRPTSTKQLPIINICSLNFVSFYQYFPGKS